MSSSAEGMCISSSFSFSLEYIGKLYPCSARLGAPIRSSRYGKKAFSSCFSWLEAELELFKIVFSIGDATNVLFVDSDRAVTAVAAPPVGKAEMLTEFEVRFPWG